MEIKLHNPTRITAEHRDGSVPSGRSYTVLRITIETDGHTDKVTLFDAPNSAALAEAINAASEPASIAAE